MLTNPKLVNEHIAKVGLSEERIMGIESDHNRICCLRGQPVPLEEITSIIDRATKMLKIGMKAVDECKTIPKFAVTIF